VFQLSEEKPKSFKSQNLVLIIFGIFIFLMSVTFFALCIHRRKRGRQGERAAIHVDADIDFARQSVQSHLSAQESEQLEYRVILAGKYSIDKVYPPLTYFEIKKILIRMKDRKFLVSSCTVCLDPISDKTVCRLLSCYHIFHKECIDDWLSRQQNCPMCKKEFNDTQDLIFDSEQFMNTINVDNEYFYSDHIMKPELKLFRSS